MVTLGELAAEFGLDKSNARKWLVGNGFVFSRKRDPVSRQMVCALTPDEAERAITLRADLGFLHPRASTKSALGSGGVFYMIQLMPESLPNRVKFGYAESLNARLQAHRTTCPRLKEAGSWPCRKVYEPAAISAAAGASTHYGGEVYDVDSIEAARGRANQFFALVGQAAA